MEFDRIKAVPGVCGGRPTVRGIRITVEFVLSLLGSEMTAQEIVEAYPVLEPEDVYQCARYAAWVFGAYEVCDLAPAKADF